MLSSRPQHHKGNTRLPSRNSRNILPSFENEKVSVSCKPALHLLTKAFSGRRGQLSYGGKGVSKYTTPQGSPSTDIIGQHLQHRKEGAMNNRAGGGSVQTLEEQKYSACSLPKDKSP